MNRSWLYYVMFIVMTHGVMAKQHAHTTLSEKVETLQEQVAAVTTTTAFGKHSITTTTAWPSEEGNDWYISAAALLWKAKIGNTAFATTNNHFSVAQPIYGYVKEPQMGWDLGLKVGGGTKLKYDSWGILSEFTYFKTNGSSSAQGGVENAIIPLKGPFASPTQYARSQTQLTFLNLDVNLSRHYFISRTLTINPLIGVKNIWDAYKQNVFYTKGPSLLGNTATTKDKSKVWGIGPQAGVNTQWYLGGGCHVTGLFSASLLYSYVQAKQHSYVTPSSGMDFFVTQKNHQFIPNMQCNVGLGWSRFLNESKNYLVLDVNYETQYYWHLNQTLSLYEFKDTFRVEQAAADIALYGVTVRVKVFF